MVKLFRLLLMLLSFIPLESHWKFLSRVKLFDLYFKMMTLADVVGTDYRGPGGPQLERYNNPVK